MMELTRKQEEALKLAVARYNLGMPYTVITGYAGAGKSTLVRFIIDALNLDEDDVAYIAYTGKAANVLKNKGCKNATTAHRLLYYCHRDKEGKLICKPRDRLAQDYKLIVVDEVSMLPEELWYLLLKHGIHVLAMGDPGQLPPPKGKPAPALENPHIFLDEIMRQAQESAIIRLSMLIREGKDFRQFPTVSGEVRIVSHKWQFPDEEQALLQASQVICGTNAERNRINKVIRSLQGRGSEPEIGDKIIGLDNHWEIFSENGDALTNGAIGEIDDFKKTIQTYPNNVKWKSFPETPLMWTNMRLEDDMFMQLPIDYTCLTTGEPLLNVKQESQIVAYQTSLIKKAIGNPSYNLMYYMKELPLHFNYGYAITCWKAQGSEYPFVLGYDCTWLKRSDPEQYIKYLYTLVTRAEKAVILVGD